jgi:phosphoribosylglycinamide formyltransferase-1
MKLAILISGRGSNMSAIITAIHTGQLNATIVGVFSNIPTAPGLEIAKANHIPTATFKVSDFPTHIAYETAIVSLLHQWHPDWIVLAGYMRIVGPTLLTPYAGKILNIHPSLLPNFKGLHAQRQALNAGATETGCTVHLVDESLDGGPILNQTKVPILPTDTEDTLSKRILDQEHRLYVEVLRSLGED